MNWLWTFLTTKSSPPAKVENTGMQNKIKEKQMKLSQEKGKKQAKDSGAKLFKSAAEGVEKSSRAKAKTISTKGGKPSIFDRLKKRPELEEEKAKKRIHKESFLFLMQANSIQKGKRGYRRRYK